MKERRLKGRKKEREKMNEQTERRRKKYRLL